MRLLPILVIVASLFALVAAACFSDEPLQGTVLEGDEAPPFALRNHLDVPMSLDDYTGDVVLVTFLYTYCPDLCPAITGHLRTAHELLLDDATRVDFVVISVDPERDTVERAHEYSEQWGMLDRWEFLVGEADVLAPIWANYFLDPQEFEWIRTEPVTAAGQSEASADSLRRQIATQYEVGHQAPVYLLDKQHRMRVLFTSPLNPREIVHDIHVLLD
jgi:protein SCO1/2